MQHGVNCSGAGGCACNVCEAVHVCACSACVCAQCVCSSACVCAAMHVCSSTSPHAAIHQCMQQCMCVHTQSSVLVCVQQHFCACSSRYMQQCMSMCSSAPPAAHACSSTRVHTHLWVHRALHAHALRTNAHVHTCSTTASPGQPPVTVSHRTRAGISGDEVPGATIPMRSAWSIPQHCSCTSTYPSV